MNKERIKHFLRLTITYIAIIGCVGGVAYWLWKNPIYNPVGPQAQTVQSDIEVRFIDATLRGRKGGIPYWTVHSKLVESERNSPMVYFKNKPNGEFYNLKDWSKNSPSQEENKPGLQNQINNPSKPDDRLRTFTWNADLAEYNTDTEDLHLKDNVNIVTDDKDTIKTNELRWNNYDQKAKSNTRTTITGHKGYPIVKADNIEGDVKMDVLNLKGHVDIETVLDEDQKL
ncbi:MAG: LPS export ABC transporter periplasmic protein LptC [Candidatus Sericytochromatia bacterium]